MRLPLPVEGEQRDEQDVGHDVSGFGRWARECPTGRSERASPNAQARMISGLPRPSIDRERELRALRPRGAASAAAD